MRASATRSPASERSAITVSSAATPAPAISTRVGSSDMALALGGRLGAHGPILADPEPQRKPTDEFRRPGRSTRTYVIERPTGDPMANTAHPGRMLFVNIPVADLERSKAFFAKLGFSYNPLFTGET